MKSFMRENKNILIGLGIFLIIVQLIGFIGMSRMEVGLYPSMDTSLHTSTSSERAELNVKMVFFAIKAGVDKFASSLEELAFQESEHLILSPNQYASAYIREALGCSSGGSFGLIVYDTVLAISYSSIGIIGAVLIIMGIMGYRVKLRDIK